MLIDNLRNALEDLAKQIKDEIHRRMESQIGYNPRAGKNTLVGSDLYNSVDVQVTDDHTLVLSILSHWEYVAKGWYHSGDYPNTLFEFHENIVDWIIRKGLQPKPKRGRTTVTIDKMAWNIVWYIFDNGIIARPFLVFDNKKTVDEQDPSVMMPFLDKMVDDMFDKIFQDICDFLDKYFTD